ncbi:hypothetical protein BT63DRAFT_291126 [Microthyrium microscopicum]|uniref:Uncharacterized protein n=1 Tax=Microthyrium microscopicum TaxID=703497 RepID=A0A6A6U7Y3_9PEZI|nr:hypothetical protein BT63DRAFT_291126 [Microthyrium microscopicum]
MAPPASTTSDAEVTMMDDNSSSSQDESTGPLDQSTNQPATPGRTIIPTSEPTPPGSDARPHPSLNANGKRALAPSASDLNTSGLDTAMAVDGPGETEPQIPPAPGHKWAMGEDGIQVEVPEDEATSQEPGAKWKTRKAQDEMRKAMEQVLDRDYMVKKRYGDILMDKPGKPPAEQTAE